MSCDAVPSVGHCAGKGRADWCHVPAGALHLSQMPIEKTALGARQQCRDESNTSFLKHFTKIEIMFQVLHALFNSAPVSDYLNDYLKIILLSPTAP